MSRTERELKEYIASHINEFFDGVITEIYVEAQVPVGFIDVLAIDEAGYRHIIEVKRKTVGVTTVYQVQRYMDYFKEIGVPAYGYTAGPSISKNASVQLAKKGFQHLSVQHQQTEV
jgi:RecB family endonuclease NucS